MRVKIFATALLVLFLATLPAFGGQIKDELAGEQPQEVDLMPDRPMRDDANLKAVQKAFDDSNPRSNVKRHPYDPDVTYKIRLREFMASTVVLPESERIAGFVIGDKHNFNFVPLAKQHKTLSNTFEVYGRYHGADTNLTVFGESGNVYSFYLRNDSVKSTYMPALVTYVVDQMVKERLATMDRLKEEKQKEAEAKNKKAAENKEGQGEYLKKIAEAIDLSQLNFEYMLKGGDESIKPMRVFDDGNFTYFQFGAKDLKKIRNLPTVYRVVDGFETPVNTRIKGGALIAETVNGNWTLRSGNKYLCIWQKAENEKEKESRGSRY